MCSSDLFPSHDTVEADVIIDPKRFEEVLNKKEVITAIRKYGVFNVDSELNKLDKISSKRYYKLLENLTYNQRNELEKELKDLGIKKKEIFFEKKNKRIYPNEDLLRPIIGFMAKTDEGGAHDIARFGIEKEHRYRDWETDRKSTRLNSSHITRSRMPSSA